MCASDDRFLERFVEEVTFKVNIKETKTTNFENIFTLFSYVSIFDFEQVSYSWVCKDT